jgi:homogentisate phytyltransferase/homogentisate geranylgeranyltransferase
VRGVVINLGLFLHFNSVLAGTTRIPPQVWALTLFILVFSVAIAIFKDIPDLEGDRIFNIKTLTVRLGQQKVFTLACWVLVTCYIGMTWAGILGLPGVQPLLLTTCHVAILGFLGWRSSRVNLQDKREIAQFYQFIWKLFFLEYLVFPIACLLK